MQLASFHPYIAPEVIGCPAPLVDQVLRLVAAEFCRETLVWTQTQDAVLLQDGVQDYEMDLPSGAYAFTVRDAWCGTRALRFSLRSEMVGIGASSAPLYCTLTEDGLSLSLYPTPVNPTESLTARVALAPLSTATTLPDFLGQRHMDAIASGVKGRLMLMPAPWNNSTMGVYYQQAFNTAVGEARTNVLHDGLPGTLTVSPRRFGF